MHEVGFPVDISVFTRVIPTLFFILVGVFYFLRNTFVKYFDIGAAAGAGCFDREFTAVYTEDCSVFEKCSRCKFVGYCSEEWQKSEWKRDMISLKPREVVFPYDEFVDYFNWDNQELAPCGLMNCGNSCFANVILQCLSWTRPLVAYLLENGHKRECMHNNDWCFFCEFQTHVERASQSRFPFSPMNIISRLTNIGGTLGYGRQEDAHEFMRYAIDMMQSVCLDEFGGEKMVPPCCQETTLIQYIFGGLLQSQVQCTVCSNVSDQYENMMDLTVEIHGDAVSLEECLDQFTAKEWLQGDNLYKCDRCNDYVKACKRLSVRCAPNILTITLKRFQGGRFGKLNKRISFPETFDLGPYMTSGGEGSDVYKLYAVIVHLDMLNASFFGHYICYVKDFRGNWYRIDDSEVENVELEDVLSQRAYMLLYSRVQTRPPSLRSEEVQDEKKTDTLNTESSQNGSVESSVVGANDTTVSSSLCNGIISHSEDPECVKEESSSSSSSPLAVSVTVSENGKEVAERVDMVESESNPLTETDDQEEEATNGKEDPVVENLAVDSSCPEITTLSPSAATESKTPEKEDSDTEMIDAAQ
uniref:Ubiquitin carboxyl-terminal hydrolase 19 n=1 Tax=Noccaea caerulescens TaxID=107243 RepID=A0A1J3J600_NOCCA